MKLRNKKTKEIHEITDIKALSDNMEKKFVIYSWTESHNFAYKTLAELNEEWEDYEEPKSTIKDVWFNSTLANGHFVEIDFINDKEAEKAVEKLKAWKRLKDKSFRFDGWHIGSISNNVDNYIDFHCDNGTDWRDISEDLDLLFGGEE